VRRLSWHGVSDKAREVRYSTARDVTELRAAQERLSKVGLAVAQTSQSVIITDISARIEYVNQAFCQVSGYSEDEVLGQNPRLLKSGLTPKATYDDMWRSLERGDTWQGEFTNRRKNGDHFMESVRISPVRQSDGRISHYLALKEDISEHKREAEAILQAKILLQRVIDSSPDSIFVKDQQHRYLLVNEAYAKSFDQAPSAMMGRCDTDFLPLHLCVGNPEKGVVGWHDDDDAVFRGETVHLPHSKLVTESSETRVFDLVKTPLRDAQQRIFGNLCYRRDITERVNQEQAQKALESRLQQAQKMELIGQLTGGIAHDFNNILASILGYTELLQMSAELQRKPQFSQPLQEILQAAIRAKELVAQLLTFSHKREVATQAIRIKPIVKEVLKLLGSTLPSTISVKIEIESGLPSVLISAVQLHQILMNLAVNARDAMAGRGTIELQVQALELDALRHCDACHQPFQGRYVRISVQDNGAGIAPENRLRIFDPFFTTKEAGHGSGLGLSVLHGIVHSAGGHIEVITALDVGTQFLIYLPAQALLSERTALALKDAILDNPVQKGARVLVVDDEASIVGFVTAFLEGLGCQVTGLTNAPEALRLFRDQPSAFDLVFTDQTMPYLTGAELARAMLAVRPELPIVMITGYSNAIDEETARQIGIRKFLVKPVPARVLMDAVTECLALQ
jgi:PAS domain S-box-containing protein